MPKTHDIFVRLDYRRGDLPDIWNLPDEWFFAALDIESECPGLIETIEKLRKLTGVDLYLGIDENPAPFSNQTILTSVLINDLEFLDLVTCPLGTFKVLPLTRKNVALKFANPIEFTAELKNTLGLLPCETEEDAQFCRVTYVASHPQMEFPPLKPDNYILGTDQWQASCKYWASHTDEDEFEEEYYYSEEYGCMVFSSEAAAEDYLNTLIENGEIEPGVYGAVIVPAQPDFRDYLIAPPKKAT